MKIAKHIIGQPVAQGDVMLIPVAALPEGKLPPIASENGNLIVTHSETSHHHIVMERPGVRMFQDAMDQFRAFLVIEGEPADLEHLRSHDTHETLRLEPGVWEVRRQREYAPEGWRRAAD
jgi:hypothetical protein